MPANIFHFANPKKRRKKNEETQRICFLLFSSIRYFLLDCRLCQTQMTMRNRERDLSTFFSLVRWHRRRSASKGIKYFLHSVRLCAPMCVSVSLCLALSFGIGRFVLLSAWMKIGHKHFSAYKRYFFAFFVRFHRVQRVSTKHQIKLMIRNLFLSFGSRSDLRYC